MVGENDKAEFLGQIIDVFEDFLAEKRIAPFTNKPQEDNDPNNPVYIHGDDYYKIEDALAEIMKKWSIVS